MKLKLVEDVPVCPVCKERRNGPCECSEIGRYLETGDTMYSAEEMRLLLSLDAVLRETPWLVEARGEQW
jgi:hypothetical protein